MPPGRRKFLEEFYAKYAPDQQLTEDRFQAIEKKYSDNNTLLKDLYGKYAPQEELSDDRINAISQKYQLESPTVDFSKPPKSEQPTDPSSELTRKQDQLLKGYQFKFQQETEPLLKSYTERYNKEVSEKQSELQNLVDSSQLSVEQANKELDNWNNQRFEQYNKEVDSKQSQMLDEFLIKNQPDIEKWNKIYQNQFIEDDFRENKVTDPFLSAWKSGKASLVYDLPSSFYSTKALGGSAFLNLDRKIQEQAQKLSNKETSGFVEDLFNKGFTLLLGDKYNPEDKKLKSELDSFDIRKREMIKDFEKAINYSQLGEKEKKYLVNSLDKVKDGDFVDYLNYVSSAVGQGIGQIPASIGTRGTTSIVQEMGSIYLDSVKKIAEEESIKSGKDVSWMDIIMQEKDDVVWPAITGMAAGLLDAYGANKLNPFNKKQILNSFRKRALALGSVVGTETVTEGLQGALENIGVSKSTGKTWEQTFKEFNWKNVTESALQGGIASLFLGGAGQGINKMSSRIASPKTRTDEFQKSEIEKRDAKIESGVLPTEGSSTAQEAGDAVQLNESQPGQQAVETGVQESTDPVGPVNAEEHTAVLGQAPVSSTTEETNPESEPELTLGQHEKRGGRWFFRDRDGALQPVIDLAKKPTPPDINQELSDLYQIQEDISKELKPKTINQKERNRIKNLDRTTVYSRARGFFFDGGKIKWKPEVDDQGNQKRRGAKSEIGGKEGERKSMFNIIDDKNGLSVDQIAQKLWENQPENESHTTEDYRDAIINLLSSDRGTWYADQKAEIDNDFYVANQEKLNDLNEIESRISSLEIEEEGIQQTIKQKYNDERRVYPATAEAGSGTPGQIQSPAATEGAAVDQGTVRNQPEPAALIRENGNEDQSQQALRELSSLNLTHVPGLGMGQNQAKGTFVSTEPVNRYQTDTKKPLRAKVNIQKPYVTDGDTFFNIQRAAINERFGKESIDDLSEPEIDLLAEFMTDYFVQEGYDSIYFPQTDFQEGELIVFDRSKVELEQEAQTVPTETQATPEPPATTKEVVEPPKKERTIAKRYMADPDVSDEIKSGLSEDGRTYIPLTNLKSQAEADAYIEEKGIDQAIEDVIDPNSGLSDTNRAFIGKTIYQTLRQQARESDSPNPIRDKMNRLMESVAKLGTRAGQTVQAFANMFTSDAEQVAYTLKKEYEKKRDSAMGSNENQFKSLKELIDQATDDAIKTVLSDPRIKALIEEGRSQEKTRQSKRKQFTAKVLSKLDELEKQIDDNLKSGRLNADFSFGLLPVAYKAAIKTIRLAVQAGDSLIDAVEKAVSEANKTSKDWDEKGFRELFAAEIKEQQKSDRKTLLEVLSDQNETFKSLALAHYKNYSGKKKMIKTVLQEELGLDEQEAERLGRTLDKIVADKRQKLIESKIPKVKTEKGKRKRKQLADKIQELTNLGVLSDKNLREAYLTSIDLPSLNDQQAQKIEDLVQKAESRPEGFSRYEAIQDLIKYHSSVTPVNWMDVAEGIYYANMLSGISTNALNFQSTSVNALLEMVVTFIQAGIEYKNPSRALKSVAFTLRGFSEGYKAGAKDSARILQTGYQPIKEQAFRDPDQFRGVKVSKVPVLETLDPKNPISWWKYFSRILAANDILFYGGFKRARAYQLAYRDAFNQNKNLPESEILKKAEQIVGANNERVDAAKRQAESEGFEGRNYHRRVYEILEQGWSENMRTDTGSFASKGTFNYDTEGFLGIVNAVIQNATQNIRLLKTVVPFARTLFNILNQYLDYTPWGLVRAQKDGMGIPGSKNFKKFTPEEVLRERIKGTLGVMTMILLFMLTDDEDDDALLELTADGTGNQKSNYELGETGWTPYTVKFKDSDIRISYQNTPLALPFATVGYLRDAKKYKGKEVSQEKLDMMLSGTISFISDMSTMSAFADFFEILSDQRSGKSIAEKFAAFGGRTVKTAVVPNLFTQTSRGIQEIIDSPMKKADNLWQQFYRDIPVVRDNLNTMYNALGEPIVTETLYKFNPIIARVTSEADEKEKDSAKLWELIAERRAWIGAPSKNTKIYDPKTEIERELNDQEYYEYSVMAGKETKRLMLNYYPELINIEDLELFKKRMDDIKTQAREYALDQVFLKLNK